MGCNLEAKLIFCKEDWIAHHNKFACEKVEQMGGSRVPFLILPFISEIKTCFP